MVAVALTTSMSTAQIVNNSSSGETSEDSLTIIALSLDSLGSPSSADSFFVVVFGGGKTNSFVFADSGSTTMIGLDTVRVGGVTYYYYSRKISDIDGAGAPGYYSGFVTAKSNSLALSSVSRFDFQIVGWELDDMGDSSGIAAVHAKATHDTLDDGFATLSPVTVGAMQTDVITDASIANLAIDIDEFTGTLATVQFEGAVMTGALLDGSWKTGIWGLDTSLVSVGFGAMLKDVDKYKAQGFSTFDETTDSVFAKGGAVDSNRTEQGGGSDSTSISRWVWNTPSGNHTISGSFGDYLDTKISGVSGGSGAFSVSLIAYDSANAQVVPGARVTIHNIDQTATLALGATSTTGAATFNLDADSFLVVVTNHAYLFPAFDTIVVTGAQSDTSKGFPIDPGSPADPNLTRVYAYLRNISNAPDKGAIVRAYLPAGVTQTSGSIISPFALSATSDSLGYVFLDLIPNADLTPDTTKYEFTIYRTDGTILRKRLIVPDSVNWRLVW